MSWGAVARLVGLGACDGSDEIADVALKDEYVSLAWRMRWI